MLAATLDDVALYRVLSIKGKFTGTFRELPLALESNNGV